MITLHVCAMRAPHATAGIETPLGPVSFSARNGFLTGVRIGIQAEPVNVGTPEEHLILEEAAFQLSEWFAGKRRDFDLPLFPLATTESQRLRAAIAAIPYGQTSTYGMLATAHDSAARAVGQACRTNAFPIIIPCHRVISTSGPEFYSGGSGPRTKTWLLDFEYDHLPPNQRTRLI